MKHVCPNCGRRFSEDDLPPAPVVVPPKVLAKGEKVRCSADNSEGVIQWGPDPLGYYLVLDHAGMAELLDGAELAPFPEPPVGGIPRWAPAWGEYRWRTPLGKYEAGPASPSALGWTLERRVL